jgi:hypothetical protein
MSKIDARQIKQDFEVRRKRQLLAIAASLFLVFFLALLYKHPVLGEISKNTIFGAQVIVITTFIGFTGFNWKCPSCNKFLGNDIGMRICRKCGSTLR